MLEDPRLFPYEIEVEGGSDEITLVGKVSTETEKATAAKIASTVVPILKSMANKLEVVKDLPDLIEHKQDDMISRHVKERFGMTDIPWRTTPDQKNEVQPIEEIECSSWTSSRNLNMGGHHEPSPDAPPHRTTTPRES